MGRHRLRNLGVDEVMILKLILETKVVKTSIEVNSFMISRRGAICMSVINISGTIATENFSVRIHVLPAASMKITVFWDVAPCSL
jgi:hypothetical protein